MNQVQKGLLLVIGVLVIILAAVLASKGYGFYQERQQEKEWEVRHHEIEEEIVNVQVQIEELAGDADALQAFLDEHVNSVLVLDEWQADESNFAGQESEPEAGEQDSAEGYNGEEEKIREVLSGAIVIEPETPVQSEPEVQEEVPSALEGENGSAGETLPEEDSSMEEINQQKLDEAAEGAIIIDEPPAPKPVVEEPKTTEKEDTVSGNRRNEEDTVSGNGRNEEDTVSGNGRNEEDTVSGNGSREEDTVSGNGNREEDTVSGNGNSEEDTVSGNRRSEEDTVSDNWVREMETISGNAIVDGRVIPFESGEQFLTLEQRRSIRSSYLETVQTNEKDKEFINNSSYDFSDVKIACLGDSLTDGSNLDYMENYQQYSYPSVLKNILHAEEVYNLGIGGSSYGRYWDKAFVDRYQEIPKDVDIILIMGGTNDGFAASDKELGSFEKKERRTFYGDVDELMQGLRRDYPKAKIIFATPLPNVLHDYLRVQRDYLLPQSVYANAIKELAAQYRIDVIDLYNSNLLDTHDAQVIANYMPDGVHGNPAGYQVLAEHMAKNIIEIVERDGLGNEYAGTVSGNQSFVENEADTVSGNQNFEEKNEDTVSGNQRFTKNHAETVSSNQSFTVDEEDSVSGNKAGVGSALGQPERIPMPEASNHLEGTPENDYKYGGEAIVIQ